MEALKRVVHHIAYTRDFSKLSLPERTLIPLLFFTSSFYKFALSLRHQLYHLGLFRKHRLPVPVISVGNLTWGGNGKTPMVDFIALWFANSGISPLILTRGYAGGDEASMLQRHLTGTSAKIGVGANRGASAASFLGRYGYIDPCSGTCFKRLCIDQQVGDDPKSNKIGAAILDDGMQHLSLWRDLEIVMVNGMIPWGNHQLLPLGPLREPLTALRRADIAVIHHADLVVEHDLKEIELLMQGIKEALPIFFTGMVPSHFFKVRNIYSKVPLRAVDNAHVLCVSAIGFANAFVQAIEKLGPCFLDRLDFSDHHLFQAKDIEMIKTRLGDLHNKFGTTPIIVVTEKDYDRDPEILERLDPFQVLVLCSRLQFIPRDGCTEKRFKNLVKQFLFQGSDRF